MHEHDGRFGVPGVSREGTSGGKDARAEDGREGNESPTETVVSHQSFLSRWLDKALDEAERSLCDLTPAVVNGQCVPTIRDLNDFSHTSVVLL